MYKMALLLMSDFCDDVIITGKCVSQLSYRIMASSSLHNGFIM